MENLFENNTTLSLSKKTKIWGTLICIAFFVLLGNFTSGMFLSFRLRDLVELVFLILPVCVINAVAIVGAFYGIGVAFKFAWKHLHFWSIILIYIVLCVGIVSGGIMLVVSIIKDLYQYHRQLKEIRAMSDNMPQLKMSRKRKLQIVIPIIVFYIIGVILGLAVHYAVS